MKDYSLVGLAKTLHGWRRPIVYGTGAVFVLSIVVSLLLPVYYSSTTVFYAASEDLFKPKVILGYAEFDAQYYGSSDDIDRIFTMATSYELVNSLVDEFDLYTHYKINPDKAKAEYYVREEFLDHYNIIRTKYDAIELTVEDKDPELAAAIANSARNKLEEILSNLIRNSQKQVVKSYITSIEEKEAALAIMYDSLQQYQTEYGIIDPEAQTEYLSTLLTSLETTIAGRRAKLEAFKESNMRGVNDSIANLTGQIAALEQQIELLQREDTTGTSNYNINRFMKAKGKVSVMDDSYKKAVNTLNIDKELLKQYQSALSLDVMSLHVVEEAEVPIIKSRPRRSLLVMASTMAAFFFLVIGVLFIESYKDVDWGFIKEW